MCYIGDDAEFGESGICPFHCKIEGGSDADPLIACDLSRWLNNIIKVYTNGKKQH